MKIFKSTNLLEIDTVATSRATGLKQLPPEHCNIDGNFAGNRTSDLTVKIDHLNGKLFQIFSYLNIFPHLQLALKHRQSKNHRMRIVAFVASPLVNDEKEVYSIRLLEIEQSNSKPSTQDRTSIVFLQLDCTTVAKPADIWSCKCKFFLCL